MPDNPKKQPSDEVDEEQLRLARAEGEAYQESVEYMAESVADSGGRTEGGDYVVGYALEKAEGLYELVGEGEFEFREPDEENCHLEVAVADIADGRFVPYCSVSATFVRDDEEHGPFDLPFLWHPGVHHYGANVELPDDGTYDIHVRIEPPEFHRHDEQNGDRYGDTVEVQFEDVDVKTGQG